MSEIPLNPIRPVGPTGELAKKPEAGKAGDPIASFKEVLENSLKKVDNLDPQQNPTVQKVVSGEQVSVADVASATRAIDQMINEMDGIRQQMLEALKGMEKWTK